MKNGSDGRNGNDGSTTSSHDSHNSHDSHSSHEPSPPPPSIILPRGDYKTLLSYQKAAVVYQITYRFCKRHLQRGDRTVDQMRQAARSGKQNIIEGSKAAAISKETEIKLTGVARASLEELLEDYEDFLTARDLRLWDKESREAAYVRKLGKTLPLSFELFRPFLETRSAEVVANIAICLIHQTNYLLDHQLKSLERNFLNEGGLRERMTRARILVREQQRHDQSRLPDK